MSSNFEDEDIILDNSPLNQYLTSLNLNNVVENEVILPKKKPDYFKFAKLQLIIFDYIQKIQCFLKRKMLGNQIFLIMKHAKQINILNEIDEMYLDYLIETRFLYWNCSLTNNESKSNNAKIFSVLLFICLLMSYLFGILTTVLTVLLLICVYFTATVSYGLLMRWLLIVFFKRLVYISTQSRHLILQLQELLSLNQGYSKLVYLDDSSNYDCSRSFNSDFVEKFSGQIALTITDFSSEIGKSIETLSEHVKKNVSPINEVPWLEEMNHTTNTDDKSYASDYKQPIGKLKHLHNLVQLQFSDFLKSIILCVYSLNNHPGLCLLMIVVCSLHEFTSLLQNFVRCRSVLQIKTKSNVSQCNNVCTESHQSIDNITSGLVHSIQTIDLHLFELSEFSSIFLHNMFKNRNMNTISFLEWLESQRTRVDKSKKHIDALQTCWKGLYDEFEELLSGKDKRVIQNNIEVPKRSFVDSLDDPKDLVILDNYPEIVDEVIEGIPEESDRTDECNYRNQLMDPFEARCVSNSQALLSELQSVIEVRAKDWRKREKLALKRRAAEGKFVFKKEDLINGNNGFEGFERRSKREVEDVDSNSNVENVEYDLDFRKSLGEMVLKQRQNMLFSTDCGHRDEECYED